MSGHHKSSFTDFMFLAVSLAVFALAIAGDAKSLAVIAKAFSGH